MKNLFSSKSILSKMACHIDSKRTKYPVYVGGAIFDGWENLTLPYAFVAEYIKYNKIPDNYRIVLFGKRISENDDYVTHVIVADEKNEIICDPIHVSCGDNIVGEYVRKVGYFKRDLHDVENEYTHACLGETVCKIKLSDFYETFFADREYFNAEIAKSDASEVIPQTNGFIVAAFVIFIYHIKGNTDLITQQALVKMESELENACSFLTRYKVGYRVFNKIIDAIKARKNVDDSIKAVIAQFGKSLKAPVRIWTTDNRITATQLNILKAFGTILRKPDSTAAYKFLSKAVTYTKSRSIVEMFSGKEFMNDTEETVVDLKASQDGLTKQMKSLMKKLTGSEQIKLSFEKEEADKLKAKDAEAFKNYLALRKALVTKSGNYLTMYVRNSREKLVDYETFVKTLDENGVRHTFPTGFIGYIDENAVLYTADKKKIILPKKVPSGTIVMNPDYGPQNPHTFVFTFDGGKGHAEDYVAKNVLDKRNAVLDLGKKIKSLSQKWRADISKHNDKGLNAAVIEIIYTFAARVGSKLGSTAGQTTYGMSNILVKHVKKQSNQYHFYYRGKKGTMQNYLLKSSHPQFGKLSRVIDACLVGKEPNDKLWTLKVKNKTLKATYSTLMTYWKSLDPVCQKAGLHKIRNAEATRMAEKLLKNHPFKNVVPKQKDVENWYKDEMKKIGDVLQHQEGGNLTSATAIENYIDAHLQKDFFLELGLRVPPFVKSALKNDKDTD